MNTDSPSSPQVDGIAAPSAPAASSPAGQRSATASPKKPAGRGLSLVYVGFAAAVLLYVVPGFIVMAMFPRPDGSLEGVRQISTLLFGVGALGWLLFGFAGLIRVAAVKEHPRMRFFGMIRLGVICVPMILFSIAVALLINIAPKLRLEITSPKSADQLIAPLSVSFGMPTALKLFEQSKLKPLKYEWDYNNDGSPDQETFDPVSTYLISKAGIYNIVCTVTMTNGQKKKVIVRLVIPRASFALLPEEPIIDEPVTFSIENFFPKSSDPKAPKLQMARWDFDGDGTVDLESDGLLVTYTYHKLGKVNVAVSMTLTNQSQSSLQRSVDVVKPPVQPFPITLETEPATLLGPPPFGVLFTLKTKEPIASATWDFDNQKSGEGLRVAHVFAAVGTYTVSVAARSQSGSVARLTKIVRVTNPLEIRDLSFDGNPDVKGFAVEGEVPLTVDLTPVTQQPLISFSWDAASAPESVITDKTFHAVYRDEGRYYVDLIGVDPDQNVFRKRLTITAIPPKSVVAFSMDPDTPTAPALVNFDASDTFIPTGEDITGFEWKFGDGSDGASRFSGARVDHQFERPGTYDIALTVRTTSGKTYTGHQTLVVRAPLFDACFVPSRSSGKAPLGVRFDTTCSTGEFVSWLWDFADGSQSDTQSPTHVFLKEGEYRVTLTATTKDGLKSVKTATISVTP